MRLRFLVLALTIALGGALGLVSPAASQRGTEGSEITIEEAIRISRANGLVRVDEAKRDNGKWEVEGRDAEGREIEIDIDARSGRVIKIERD